MPHSERLWTDVVREKRDQREKAVTQYSQLQSNGLAREDARCNGSHRDVTSILSVDELQRILLSREITASELTHAYIEKHMKQQTNCLTEPLFQNAHAQAADADHHLDAYGTVTGPLHGIPMSLKDQFDVKGVDTTLGYVGRAFQPARDESILVEMLRGMGAVFIGKTNLPQSIMWCETDNPLFGRTSHPRDPALTPGGSSGGEAALLALHGALIGWGTDIGGSVRIPAHMCGIYGFKPSSGRLPYQGVSVTTSGQEHVPSVIGPMARSLPLLRTAMTSILSLEPWRLDPKVVPLPWREATYQSTQSHPLVIGLLLDDGIVRPHPPIARAVARTADLLRRAGHEVVDWNADGHAECIDIMDEYYIADSGEDISLSLALGGEPAIPAVAGLLERARARQTPFSVFEYWGLNRRKVDAQKRMLDKWGGKVRVAGGGTREVDVVIMPTMPHCAVEHGMCKWVGYTKVWNLVDYVGCVVPAGFVGDGAEEEGVESWRRHEPRNDVDALVAGLYDPVKMKGLPLSVQVVGRRLDEERVLGAAKVVDDLLRAQEKSS
ncbi:MAG: hypothetical protein M1828_006075 [Chrysothrix sp. TS-e1954]|nr:MAG: hypothetical protein M1828_006075 [Chrysothrix sp. TS-e1954]